MYAYRARLASFERPKHTSKKRTSSQSKKKTTTNPAWPHQTPRPDDLARAGFFFQPDDTEGDDNVKCFSCRACLNGWEPNDDPIIEHVSHRPDCAWATAVSVVRREGVESDDRDPLSEQLHNARLQTFSQGTWPHEQEEGHFCTAQRMADAGWCLDAGPGYEDSATCFYCDLALDGWEAEDDPMEEHRKRQPDCRFFELLKRYHSTKGQAKSKTKGTKNARSSKASRASVQSTVSMAPSEMTTYDDASGDEVVAAEPKSSKSKKASRSTATKSSKGRKQTQTDAEVVEHELEEPSQPVEETKPVKKPKKTTKKSTKISTVSSTQDADNDAPVPKQKKTTKKASAVNKRVSNAADQLQDELEESIIDQFPQPTSKSSQQSSRGVKRTSDGSAKDRDSSIMVAEFPVPPQSAKQQPVSRTSKAKSITFEVEVEEATATAITHPSATQGGPRPTKRAKSARSTKSAQSSHAYDTTLEDALVDEEERAIELELARIEKEQQEREINAQRQTKAEPSNGAFEILQDEVDEEPYYHPMLPLVAMTGSTIRNTPTPSPTGSDKENTSSLEAAKSAHTPVYMSPTKTTRIPLAPSTPNRMLPSANAGTVSPRKLLGATRSTVAWKPVDLDSVLLLGPQATPNKLREILVTAAGSLTADERKMTIEEWLRSRARQQEQELQRRGEEMVATFEAEGNRALGCLEGMHVAV
ncbi:hypothetical protein AMS68_003398 [Peltaster fructicola]|uniref:BIR-domain-containing protein n=1 Tax=Peltaster fructicola TaxID=286661 RepID=A0A6H0XT88_9PEZI|nr:hypothetical protein AMS68_003398 [Peltaster fructicola]